MSDQRPRRHRTRSVARVARFAIVAVALWGLSDRLDASAGSEPDGQSLFVTGCSSCHGVDGHGVTTADGQVRGVDITQASAALAYFEVSTGRMPLGDSNDPPVRKPAAYDGAQTNALVRYVASFGNGPPLPAVDLTGADLAEGGQIYRANCQACHSAAGAGGALSYGESAPALDDSEPLQVGAAVRSGPGRMPIFGPDAIDQQSLNDVTSYVQYLRDPQDPGGVSLGRTGPVPEGFVALTLGIGALLAAVFWIGTRSRIARRRQEGQP
ncbi:MAG: qcrC [Ilumatobacteraceae bacterium]|nr:qcrC [Ilumatobacteraceae bacterium]